MGGFADMLDLVDDAVLTNLGATEETMTYAPSSGPAIENVPVLFDDDTAVQQPFQQRAEFPKPRVWFKLAAIAPNDPYTDEPILTIRGKGYRIHQRPKDGQIGGSIHLRLHEIP